MIESKFIGLCIFCTLNLESCLLEWTDGNANKYFYPIDYQNIYFCTPTNKTLDIHPLLLLKIFSHRNWKIKQHPRNWTMRGWRRVATHSNRNSTPKWRTDSMLRQIADSERLPTRPLCRICELLKGEDTSPSVIAALSSRTWRVSECQADGCVSFASVWWDAAGRCLRRSNWHQICNGWREQMGGSIVRPAVCMLMWTAFHPLTAPLTPSARLRPRRGLVWRRPCPPPRARAIWGSCTVHHFSPPPTLPLPPSFFFCMHHIPAHLNT